MIKLASTLVLPLDAVTQTFGILAVRGAGKSNAAAVMAEQMFKAGLPFVVVDPVGNWYGLRSSSDGKEQGLPIAIFGGKRGDVPLEKTGGILIADLVVDQRLTCILDISEFSEGDKTRFLMDFAERLYKRNEDPLHLFLEEADDYIPQKPWSEQARTLRAFENIVKRGRSRGLGITMITQRSAAINKNVLTQIETLIVLRTTSPQDRKAIEGWVEYHGQSKELLESLPSLDNGEAWVWSPHWLKTVKRVQINRRETYDSAATPKQLKHKRPAATLADVDLGALKERMAATIEKAKAEDPKELRRQIAELKRELSSKQAVPTKAVRVGTKEVSVLKEAQITKLSGVAARLERTAMELGQIIGAQFLPALKRASNPSPLPPRFAISTTTAITHHPRPERAPRAEPGGISASQQRILNALAWLEAIGRESINKTTLALMADQSPTSGGYFNNLGALRSAGLITYPEGNVAALTAEGRAKAEAIDVPTTSEELHAMLLRKLSRSQGEIIKILIERYPAPVSKVELAELAGQSPTSGGYFNNLGRLRSLGLIDYPPGGFAVALPVLWLEK